MDRKCRILSIFVIAISVMVIFVAYCIIVNKPKEEIVYANDISFCSIIGGFEMCVGNELVLNDNMVKISPSNCSFKPEFTIQKRDEDEKEIKTDRYSFSYTGQYTLKAKVKANENYYINDTLIITVVENPISTTSVYIDKLPLQTVYVEQEILLSQLANIKYPTSSVLEVKCSEHVIYEQGKLKTIKEGAGVIEVYITYENITIMETIVFNVKAKIEDTGTQLILTANGNVVQNNSLRIEYSRFNFSINYELTNLEHNQQIMCWTNSDIVEVVSYNTPTIVLKTLSVGEAVIYVSPIDYPHIIFEIVVSII